MSNIRTLSNEIKKQTTIYNDILVGMHADINVYKKRVELQGEATGKVLRTVRETIKEVELLKTKAETFVNESVLIFEKLEHQHSEMSSVSTAFYERLDAYSQQLETYEVDVLSKINSAMALIVGEKAKIEERLIAVESAQKESFNALAERVSDLSILFGDDKREMDAELESMRTSQQLKLAELEKQMEKGTELTYSHKKDVEAELTLLKQEQYIKFDSVFERLTRGSAVTAVSYTHLTLPTKRIV